MDKSLMQELTWYVKAGGPPILWLLFLTGPSVIVAVLYAAAPRRISVVFPLVAMIAAVLVGGFGFVLGWTSIPRGIENVPAELREAFLAQGLAENLIAVKAAGGLVALLGIFIIVGQVRRRRHSSAVSPG
jgi:hypothetical protein